VDLGTFLSLKFPSKNFETGTFEILQQATQCPVLGPLLMMTFTLLIMLKNFKDFLKVESWGGGLGQIFEFEIDFKDF